MFGVNRGRKAVSAILQARRDSDAAILAFLQVFKGDTTGLDEELLNLSGSELTEFLLAVCELKALSILPCRCRSEMAEFLMGACENLLARAIGRLASTDALGTIAAHDSLPEALKNAARTRIQGILEAKRFEAEATQSQSTESSTETESQSDDYGSGRYCTGCGGC